MLKESVAQALNQEDVPTPRGPAWSHIYSGRWTDTTIRSILVNPVYAGDLVWNRRTDARFHSIRDGQAVERENAHGARLVPNDESDWLVVLCGTLSYPLRPYPGVPLRCTPGYSP